MRVLEPGNGILAFYDGREDPRADLSGLDWVEVDLALGLASYALVVGSSAIVYDTHTSPDRGALLRAELERRGVVEFTVVLSHWHLDHVAGTAAFGDCPVVATARTAKHLAEKREAIESGSCLGPPAIDPLVMPTETFQERLELRLGERTVELLHMNIHSDDAAVLWLADEEILLAGDTVEDTITFVDAPESLEAHLADLDRLAALGPRRVLPCHGDPARIGGGGYGPGLIDATRCYIERLLEAREDESLRRLPLCEFMADSLAAGDITYFAPYEAVHRGNVERLLALG